MELLRSNGGVSASRPMITAAALTTIGASRNGRFTQVRTTFGDGSMLVHASVNDWWSWLTTLPMTFGSVTCLALSPASDGGSTEFVWTLNKHMPDGATVVAPSR